MYSLQTSFVYTLYIYIYNLLLCISLFLFYISSCYANRRNITAILCKYIYINIFIHIAYILGKNKYAMVYAYKFIYILRARKVREVFFLNVYGRNFWRFQPEPIRPSDFCEPCISATTKVIILQQKPKDAHFCKLRLFIFSK